MFCDSEIICMCLFLENFVVGRLKKKNFLINKIIVKLLFKLYHILKHYYNWTVLKRKFDSNVLCVKISLYLSQNSLLYVYT